MASPGGHVVLMDELEGYLKQFQIVLDNMRTPDFPLSGEDARQYLVSETIQTAQQLRSFSDKYSQKTEPYGADQAPPEGKPSREHETPDHSSVDKGVKPAVEGPEIERLRGRVAELDRLVKQLQDDNETERRRSEQLQEANAVLLETLDCETKKKDEALTRLSEVASKQLQHNNPALADLGDINRPTKIGEQFAELYDNEWTDAYYSLLDSGHSETAAITNLKDLLTDVWRFCVETADGQLQRLEKTLYDSSQPTVVSPEHTAFEPPCSIMDVNQYTLYETEKITQTETSSHGGFIDIYEDTHDAESFVIVGTPKRKVQMCHGSADRGQNTEVKKPFVSETRRHLAVQNETKSFRKSVAIFTMDSIIEVYMQAQDGSMTSEVAGYTKKCLSLCWLMSVQTPPMIIRGDPATQSSFNKDLYGFYTRSGPLLDFVVWPPLLLHENGPLVTKGVAQGMKVSPVS